MLRCVRKSVIIVIVAACLSGGYPGRGPARRCASSDRAPSGCRADTLRRKGSQGPVRELHRLLPIATRETVSLALPARSAVTDPARSLSRGSGHSTPVIHAANFNCALCNKAPPQV